MRRSSKTLRDRARSLRRMMTTSEWRLWKWLRNRSFGGFKFRRQFPVGPYVLDFYCPDLQLGIEVDGAHHETPWMADYDDARTRRLAKLGIQVVRIPNVLLATDSWLAGDQLRYWIDQRARELGR